MRVYLYPLFGILSLFPAQATRADVDVRVGSGANCSTSSIQTAINNANSANGITNILIARNATYNTNWLNITSKNVRLIGGYADCNQTVRDATQTLINGAGGSKDSVIKVRGTTAVVAFYNLEIIGGDAIEPSGGNHGGGVEIEDGPHTLVYFENVWIHNNEAIDGGGLWIKNENSTNPNDVFVQLSHNTRIYANSARRIVSTATDGDGGGIWCSNATVDITGGVSSTIGSYIAGNNATDSGGGIRAENCVMNIATSSPILNTISGNTAGGPGGGISVSGQRAIIKLYNQTGSWPTRIYNNVAGGVGGAIDIGSSAQVTGWDVILTNNISRSGGGAVSLFDSDAAPDATFVMQGTLNGAPNNATSPEGAAVNCLASFHCNRISSNEAVETGGAQRTGAAIRASTAGGDASDETRVALYGTEVQDNRGENVLEMTGDQVTVDFNGVALFNNVVSNELLHAPDDLHHLHVFWSTIAGNAIGGAATFRSSMDGSAPNATWGTQFKNSIHWQPGKRVYSVVSGTVNSSNTDYLLSNDLAGIPGSTHNLVGEPQFVDSTIKDYRLKINSPAVDFAFPDASAPTADHLPRLKDLSTVLNEFGAQDLGAYERQSPCADDAVFCNGFE